MKQSGRNSCSNIIGIVFIIMFAVMFFAAISSNLSEESINTPWDYVKVTDVDYKAVVLDEPDGSGKMLVTERLTFDIHAASKSNLFWELWRALPESYIDGVPVYYEVNSVKQILEDGTAVEYQKSPKLYWSDSDFTDSHRGYGPGKWFHSEGPYSESRRQYECVLFYVDGLYRETAVFEIEYTMFNAALRYGDCSELYITPYSESTINDLKSFKGQILVPSDIMPRAGNYTAHTYGTNASSFPFTESDSANPGYHTFMFELDKSDLKFRPYNEYIEFTLVSYGEDKHIFTNHASVNHYYNDNVLAELNQEQAKYDALPNQFKTAKIAVLLLSLVFAALVAAYSFGVDKRMKKKYRFFEPATQPEYFRDIPSELDPAFAAALVFSRQKPPKDTLDGYSAVMLSLVRKGYVELERIDPQQDWKPHNVKIVVTCHPVAPPAAAPQPMANMAPQPVPYAPPQAVPAMPQQPMPGTTPPAATPQPTPGAPPQAPPLLEPLGPSEAQYFNLILRHAPGGEITLNLFQQKISADYQYTNSFIRNNENAITSIGVSQGYFQKADYKQPARQIKQQSTGFGIIGALIIIIGNLITYPTRMDFAFGAFFILGIAFFAGAVYLRRVSKKYVLLTQFGENEYAKWRGLYNFFNSATLLSERTVIELPVWERYLIYATAFGISEKVIAAINIRCPHVEMSPVLRNPYYRSASFRVSARSFHSATRSASARGGSSGFGGHGGYGGGGRGGGGGGGGH